MFVPGAITARHIGKDIGGVRMDDISFLVSMLTGGLLVLLGLIAGHNR